jgi:hypothetical protein
VNTDTLIVDNKGHHSSKFTKVNPSEIIEVDSNNDESQEARPVVRKSNEEKSLKNKGKNDDEEKHKKHKKNKKQK